MASPGLPQGGETRSPARGLKAAAGFLGRTLVVFLLFEGLASTWHVGSSLARTRLAAERLHTRYDAELGWSNVPGLRLPDLYGPGLSLTINSQGFRAPRDYPAAAGDKLRVICSGDSFTLGYGLSDAEPWCRVLETLDPRLEGVNMGQGGYGLDQAYLWYRRDGARLEHQAQVMAFISDDFARMLKSDFFGFPKPVLAVEGGRLQARNVPVPRAAYALPWLTANVRTLHELRSLALLSGLYARLRPAPAAFDDARLPELILALFDDLRRLNQERGSQLLLVYLPTLEECGSAGMEAARRALLGELERRGFALVDLLPEFCALPPAALDPLFLPARAGARHLSARGNRVVAERVHAALVGLPEISARLAAAPASEPKPPR